MVSGITDKKRASRQTLYANAARMRREPTPAEARFWHYAKNRGIDGLKFRRQVAIGPYIVDFICVEEKLVVEIDGGQHGGDHDAKRDAYLLDLGLRTMRFWNSDVLSDMNAVADTILAV